jgi:hypothetical protein
MILLAIYQRNRDDRATNTPKIKDPAIPKIIPGVFGIYPPLTSQKYTSAGRIKMIVNIMPITNKQGNEIKTVIMIFFANNLALRTNNNGRNTIEVIATNPRYTISPRYNRNVGGII